jgi:uncharacterized tellurite resistance protein B-like protein
MVSCDQAVETATMDPGRDLAHHARVMDSKDRILYVQILAQMLIADGVLADEERAYLDRIMDSLEMPADERQRALGGVSIDSPVEERVRALGDAFKKQLLAEVEKALNVDGQVTRSEQYFLERVKKLIG